ncbi:succinylglutamic semialdehyde dehydrogenase, partial [Yersinia pestis PY-15]|jgi:hypothetical protein
MNG